MPRHPMPRNRGKRSLVARGPRSASHLDRTVSLRALIQAGTVAAAALAARDDLGAAAISTQRLGSLTSGMWRALSRELMTAAERLDRQSDEYLDDMLRRRKRSMLRRLPCLRWAQPPVTSPSTARRWRACWPGWKKKYAVGCTRPVARI